MKILSYEFKGDKIRVKTDNVSRPVFVYKKDKFHNLKELKIEIQNSINYENMIKSKRTIKINKLILELQNSKIEELEYAIQ